MDDARWSFIEIANADPARAAKLESAGTPEQLLERLTEALQRAIASENLRVARDHKTGQTDDCRAVVQFHVGTDLFDWFFNARAGYRAHFRELPQCGLQFNGQVIDAMRDVISKSLPNTVRGHELYENADLCIAADIPTAFLLKSLVADLAKIWVCNVLIERDGSTTELAMGIGGPPVVVDATRWTALYPEEDQAWLDVKGAFLGPRGAYQPKDPLQRAQRLHDDGTA